MNKSLLRFVALFLVPCLIADPVLASGMRSAFSPNPPVFSRNPVEPFSEQALVAAVVAAVFTRGFAPVVSAAVQTSAAETIRRNSTYDPMHIILFVSSVVGFIFAMYLAAKKTRQWDENTALWEKEENKRLEKRRVATEQQREIRRRVLSKLETLETSYPKFTHSANRMFEHLIQFYPSKAHQALRIEKAEYLKLFDRTDSIRSLKGLLDSRDKYPELSSIAEYEWIDGYLNDLVGNAQKLLSHLEDWLDDAQKGISDREAEQWIEYGINEYIRSLEESVKKENQQVTQREHEAKIAATAATLQEASSSRGFSKWRRWFKISLFVIGGTLTSLTSWAAQTTSAMASTVRLAKGSQGILSNTMAGIDVIHNAALSKLLPAHGIPFSKAAADATLQMNLDAHTNAIRAIGQNPYALIEGKQVLIPTLQSHALSGLSTVGQLPAGGSLNTFVHTMPTPLNIFHPAWWSLHSFEALVWGGIALTIATLVVYAVGFYRSRPKISPKTTMNNVREKPAGLGPQSEMRLFLAPDLPIKPVPKFIFSKKRPAVSESIHAPRMKLATPQEEGYSNPASWTFFSEAQTLEDEILNGDRNDQRRLSKLDARKRRLIQSAKNAGVFNDTNPKNIAGLMARVQRLDDALDGKDISRTTLNLQPVPETPTPSLKEDSRGVLPTLGILGLILTGIVFSKILGNGLYLLALGGALWVNISMPAYILVLSVLTLVGLAIRHWQTFHIPAHFQNKLHRISTALAEYPISSVNVTMPFIAAGIMFFVFQWGLGLGWGTAVAGTAAAFVALPLGRMRNGSSSPATLATDQQKVLYNSLGTVGAYIKPPEAREPAPPTSLQSVVRSRTLFFKLQMAGFSSPEFRRQAREAVETVEQYRMDAPDVPEMSTRQTLLTVQALMLLAQINPSETQKLKDWHGEFLALRTAAWKVPGPVVLMTFLGRALTDIETALSLADHMADLEKPKVDSMGYPLMSIPLVKRLSQDRTTLKMLRPRFDVFHDPRLKTRFVVYANAIDNGLIDQTFTDWSSVVRSPQSLKQEGVQADIDIDMPDSETPVPSESRLGLGFRRWVDLRPSIAAFGRLITRHPILRSLTALTPAFLLTLGGTLDLLSPSGFFQKLTGVAVLKAQNPFAPQITMLTPAQLAEWKSFAGTIPFETEYGIWIRNSYIYPMNTAVRNLSQNRARSIYLKMALFMAQYLTKYPVAGVRLPLYDLQSDRLIFGPYTFSRKVPLPGEPSTEQDGYLTGVEITDPAVLGRTPSMPALPRYVNFDPVRIPDIDPQPIIRADRTPPNSNGILKSVVFALTLLGGAKALDLWRKPLAVNQAQIDLSSALNSFLTYLSSLGVRGITVSIVAGLIIGGLIYFAMREDSMSHEPQDIRKSLLASLGSGFFAFLIASLFWGLFHVDIFNNREPVTPQAPSTFTSARQSPAGDAVLPTPPPVVVPSDPLQNAPVPNPPAPLREDLKRVPQTSVPESVPNFPLPAQILGVENPVPVDLKVKIDETTEGYYLNSLNVKNVDFIEIYVYRSGNRPIPYLRTDFIQNNGKITHANSFGNAHYIINLRGTGAITGGLVFNKENKADSDQLKFSVRGFMVPAKTGSLFSPNAFFFLWTWLTSWPLLTSWRRRSRAASLASFGRAA